MPKKKPSRIWRAFEAAPGLARAAVEWQRLLGPEFEKLRPHLRARQQPATSVPCPAKRSCGCYHGVISHGHDDLVAVCRCEGRRCPTISVARADVVVYEVHAGGLGAAIAVALGAKAEHRTLGGLHATWHVGTYAPRAGVRLPLYLAIHDDPKDFHQAVTTLAATDPGPFVLIAPTEAAWKPEHHELLRGKNARFLALAEFMDWNGKMSAKQPIEKLLPDLFEELGPAAAETTVFRREGDVWRVVFEGRAVSLKHSIGLACLHQLLKNQDQDIHTSMLQAAASQAVPAAPGSADIVHDAEADGEYAVAADQRDMVPAGSVLDQQAIDEYKARMENIESELREAETNNDTGRVEQLKREFNLLSQEVGRATGLHGQLRDNNDAERSRKAVSNAIHRAYAAIKKAKHSALEKHLQKTVKIATFLSYRPEKPIPWAT